MNPLVNTISGRLSLRPPQRDCRSLWVKPAPGKFQIFYRGDHAYEPDFVIETNTQKLLCEVKAARDIDDADVAEKTRAALQWCRHASDHEGRHGGKPWKYVLVPHDAIEANRTVAGTSGAVRGAIA